MSQFVLKFINFNKEIYETTEQATVLPYCQYTYGVIGRKRVNKLLEFYSMAPKNCNSYPDAIFN